MCSVWIIEFNMASIESDLERGLNKGLINTNLEEAPMRDRHQLMEMPTAFNEVKKSCQSDAKDVYVEAIKTMPIGDLIWIKEPDGSYVLGWITEMRVGGRDLPSIEWHKLYEKEKEDKDAIDFLNSNVKFPYLIYRVPLQNRELINLTYDTYNRKSAGRIKYALIPSLDEDEEQK